MDLTELHLTVMPDRPVVRNDVQSEIDIVIDLTTSRRIGDRSESYDINLCVVVDRSGSMSVAGKLEQAKQSCISIWESLGPNDHFTVLAFDDEVVSVINPQTPRDDVTNRIQALAPGGMTNISKGWYLGLLELQTYASDRHINRLVLLSDGQANLGEQKPSVLSAESGRARDELRITTSTIGIGNDFQEDIMAVLAHESGGRFWYIGAYGIEDIVREEFGGALSVFLERPSVKLSIPSGVSVQRELNILPKVADRYRLRPIKANDHFSFAVRLTVDPLNSDGAAFTIGATLLDGPDEIQSTNAQLAPVTIGQFVQTPQDPYVAMVAAKFLAASTDEEIVAQSDSGNVEKMVQMLETQSSLLRDLEAKLAGSHINSWEEMEDSERRRRDYEMVERSRMSSELSENEASLAVMQLIALLNGIGESNRGNVLYSMQRKMSKHRSSRNVDWHDRGQSDDTVAADLLIAAKSVANGLLADYPDLTAEVDTIVGQIDEQLARFS